MIERRKFHAIEELQWPQYFATRRSYDVSLHPLDGSITIGAKSHIGIYALSSKEPILAMSESKEFFDMIKGIGEALE